MGVMDIVLVLMLDIMTISRLITTSCSISSIIITTLTIIINQLVMLISSQCPDTVYPRIDRSVLMRQPRRHTGVQCHHRIQLRAHISMHSLGKRSLQDTGTHVPMRSRRVSSITSSSQPGGRCMSGVQCDQIPV